MATNGQRGQRFEHQCRDRLTALGMVVIRSAASKTPVDLVVLPGTPWLRGPDEILPVPGPVWLLQAKRDGRLDPGEWNALYDLSRQAKAVAVLARQEQAGRRLVPVFYRLTGPRVPRSRTWPMESIRLPEVADGT